MKSGISDYSEILVYGLRKFFDITLLTDNYKLENKRLYKDFKVKRYKKDIVNLDSYDFKIYNIGNHPEFHSYIYECAINHPGMIILHDLVQYYLVIGYYRDKSDFYSKIYEIGGARAISLLREPIKHSKDLLQCKEIAPQLPLNSELIQSGNLIMTHSMFTFNKVSNLMRDKTKVTKINHVELTKDVDLMDKDTLLDQFDIDRNSMLVCSFGYVDRTKLNDKVCTVVNRMNSESGRKITYLMVGDGVYVDNYLGEYIKKTGFVDLRTFNSFIQHCDLVVNLRNSSMGETSGALIRAMGLGRPCIVSDEGWFSELPNDAVIKVKEVNCKESLYKSLSSLKNNEQKRIMLSKKAKSYIAKHYSIEKISREIYNFINPNINSRSS